MKSHVKYNTNRNRSSFGVVTKSKPVAKVSLPANVIYPNKVNPVLLPCSSYNEQNRSNLNEKPAAGQGINNYIISR